MSEQHRSGAGMRIPSGPEKVATDIGGFEEYSSYFEALLK